MIVAKMLLDFDYGFDGYPLHYTVNGDGTFSPSDGRSYSEDKLKKILLDNPHSCEWSIKDFLEKFTSIQSIDVNRFSRDLGALSGNKNVVELMISDGLHSNEILDLKSLPNLVQLSLFSDSAKNSNFDFTLLENLENKNLKCLKLTRSGFFGHGFSIGNCFPNIQNLEINFEKDFKIDELKNLPLLEELELAYLRNSLDLSLLPELPNRIKNLRLEACKNITGLGSVFQITDLEIISLENMGEIESLRPLTKLKSIRNVTLVNTKVIDGKMCFLLDHGFRGKLYFTNYRHYDARWQDFENEMDVGQRESSPKNTDYIGNPIYEFFWNLHEEGFAQYSPEVISCICDIMDSFLRSIGSEKNRHHTKYVLAQVQNVTLELNKLNEIHNGELFETEEREYLVQIINNFAEDSGLDLGDFDNEDPTFEYREF